MTRQRTLWTFAITSLALFMVTLDNLVVSTAIPVIRRDLHASISQLEWTVNAYTLTFAVLLRPLVGGAVVQGISWHWIFWLNVPIGLVMIPLALARLEETRGPEGHLDLRGLGLVSTGLFALVWALVRGNEVGWGTLQIA